jgi:hypothetical protein
MPLLSPLLSVGALKHASVCCAPLPPAAAAPSGLTSAGQVTFTQRSSRILQQYTTCLLVKHHSYFLYQHNTTRLSQYCV